MKIVIASGNAHKIAELRDILAKFIPSAEVLSMKDAGIDTEITENGKTFEENAMIKAKAVASYGYIGVGDDSGLSVDALGGAPGIYSARYAGEHGNDKANNAKLLSALESVSDRDAKFVCAIACVFPSGESFCVRGEAKGQILYSASGSSGFGYDPLFFYPPMGKSFAELSPEEKNSVSHRAVALEAFAKEFALRITQK